MGKDTCHAHPPSSRSTCRLSCPQHRVKTGSHELDSGGGEWGRHSPAPPIGDTEFLWRCLDPSPAASPSRGQTLGPAGAERRPGLGSHPAWRGPPATLALLPLALPLPVSGDAGPRWTGGTVQPSLSWTAECRHLPRSEIPRICIWLHPSPTGRETEAGSRGSPRH